MDYGAKDAFKRGYKPQYPIDSDIDNWSHQFEPLCRTKKDCIKLFKIFLDGPPMLISLIITNYGDFPEKCQEMFLKRKYEYVNKVTNRAAKSRGAHQSTDPKYYTFNVVREYGIDSRYNYDIFADEEPRMTGAQVNDLFTRGYDPVAEYHDLREHGERLLARGLLFPSALEYGSLVEIVQQSIPQSIPESSSSGRAYSFDAM